MLLELLTKTIRCYWISWNQWRWLTWKLTLRKRPPSLSSFGGFDTCRWRESPDPSESRQRTKATSAKRLESVGKTSLASQYYGNHLYFLSNSTGKDSPQFSLNKTMTANSGRYDFKHLLESSLCVLHDYAWIICSPVDSILSSIHRLVPW